MSKLLSFADMDPLSSDRESPFGKYRPSALQWAVLKLCRIPPLYRGTLRPFWVRVLDRIRPGPVDILSVYGRFRVYPTTNLVDSALLLHPCYNASEMDFLRGELPRDGVFLDLGANIGLYSVAIASHLSGQGRVIAIEPNPICAERLRFNCDANGITNCSVQQFAIGDFEGRARLVMREDDLAIVTIVRDDKGGDIEVRPLMAILRETGITRMDALKIDIEGYEYAALAPFFRDAPASLWPKAISIEHLGDKEDILKLLVDCGYIACGRTRNNAFFRRSGISRG